MLAWFLVFVALPAFGAPATTDLAWTHHANALEWSAQVEEALKITALPGILPSDIMDFCRGYSKQSESGRAHFWAGLLSAIAKKESNFDTNQSFTESFHEHGPDSPLVISRGLLQLSFPGDADRYQCTLKRAEDLFDPRINLGCGATILSVLVKRDHRVAGRDSTGWKGGAAYWSTLRSTGGKNNSNASSLTWIKRFTNSLSVCQP